MNVFMRGTPFKFVYFDLPQKELTPLFLKDQIKLTAMKTFRDLIVWQKAMELVTLIYQLSKSFPKDELYGLISQMRRTAVSIPANIAEGYGRRSTQDYLRFLQIAMSSNFELQTLLEIARNLHYLSTDSFENAFDKSREIERMLSSLIKKVSSK